MTVALGNSCSKTFFADDLAALFSCTVPSCVPLSTTLNRELHNKLHMPMTYPESP